MHESLSVDSTASATGCRPAVWTMDEGCEETKRLDCGCRDLSESVESAGMNNGQVEPN